jgi:hypothetical protein
MTNCKKKTRNEMEKAKSLTALLPGLHLAAAKLSHLINEVRIPLGLPPVLFSVVPTPIRKTGQPEAMVFKREKRVYKGPSAPKKKARPRPRKPPAARDRGRRKPKPEQKAARAKLKAIEPRITP